MSSLSAKVGDLMHDSAPGELPRGEGKSLTQNGF